MSLGDKRKVAVGSVAICDNILIMINEPFDGVDAAGRRRVHKFINDLIQ